MSNTVNHPKFKKLQNWQILLLVFVVAISIRLYYLPFDLPLVLDAENYFWYANDLSLLGSLPNAYDAHNNFWPTILSLFFSVNQSNEILDYMNIQRLLSSIISSLTIFPMYFLCKKFFSRNYAIIGASFFVLDPRIIINSLLGITEPIYIIIGVLIILFSLDKNEKFYYISFALAAIFALIRYEGLIIVFPLTIIYFWKFKIHKKSIIKYGLCVSIFLLILLPMVSARIQTTGEDGLTSHIFAGTNYVSKTFSGTFEKQDKTDFLKDGIVNSVTFLGWITIPIWIVFLPYGILKYFKKLDLQKNSLLLYSVILILPAIYAYSRDIQETRYLYVLFPLFTIISLYSIEKMSEGKNFKLISLLILVGITVGSVGWIEYKWIDKEHEKEAFELSYKIKELTKGVNELYPESAYLKFIDPDGKFPRIKNEIKEVHKVIATINYKKMDEFISNEKENGLTHIIIDNSNNPKNQRPEFLSEIFDDENKYRFLEKIYDSKDDGFEYHLKIFKIKYELFNEFENQINEQK